MDWGLIPERTAEIMFEKIGFIGTGNMGGAIARAVKVSAVKEKVYLSDAFVASAENLAKKIPGAFVSDNGQIARECDLIFLGVKPQVLPAVLEEIAPILAERTDRFVLVTMAAGTPIDKVMELTAEIYPVIRIMPNTPVSIGKGVVEYCGKNVTEEELDEFQALLAGSGRVVPLPENLIDAASAVAGCGPAFVYMFIEALADGAVACGLPRKAAMELAAAMVEGSAKMVLETGMHPGELKDAVCSPGGTTIQGVRALEDAGFRGACMEAVIAAYEKTLELKNK